MKTLLDEVLEFYGFDQPWPVIVGSYVVAAVIALLVVWML
jgi:hypothetical protein